MSDSAPASARPAKPFTGNRHELARKRARMGRPKLSDEALIAEVRRVSRCVSGTYTRAAYLQYGRYSDSTLRNRFGAWRDILEKAGMAHRDARPRRGGRHSWEECYANLERLFQIYGRLPTCIEIERFPSTVGWNAYHLRFGGWRLAKHHFLAYRHGKKEAWPMPGTKRGPAQQIKSFAQAALEAEETRRREAFGPLRIPVKLRMQALERDRFRCTRCGASPANDHRVVLHIDHVFPRSRGGFTGIENLRVLCRPCNLWHGTGDV